MDITLSTPDWVARELSHYPELLLIHEDRMRMIIHFSRLNFEYGTGGPFAAGVFEQNTGKIISVGVNIVVPSNCSSAHAEMIALSIAQKKLETFDLGGPGMASHGLVVNWRPCVMCYGAVLWSGVRSLVIAGSGKELEEITGFDEGPLHQDWKEELKRRGINVTDNVLGEEACKVFRAFTESNGFVYNPCREDPLK
ncbi:MAG: nucleoside deaminase [Candidatus Scalindua rubra]|uniref:Putative deaminase n=1 Tax=Candidatus Scalindua brodae TaxID=237368 RepID=A0A0B0ENA8_9BACT|nr:MAG: putative deaminase [Candidatus Scalindua brodae]MBZ0110009.1 nucleoside deaminase [Candidatus Scalindua rubra]